jgi:hypothetical protein
VEKKILMKEEGTSCASAMWFNMMQENQVQVISACDTCRKGEVEIRDMRDRYRRVGCYFFPFQTKYLKKVCPNYHLFSLFKQNDPMLIGMKLFLLPKLLQLVLVYMYSSFIVVVLPHFVL